MRPQDSDSTGSARKGTAIVGDVCTLRYRIVFPYNPGKPGFFEYALKERRQIEAAIQAEVAERLGPQFELRSMEMRYASIEILVIRRYRIRIDCAVRGLPQKR
jgi:hypothetical protein